MSTLVLSLSFFINKPVFQWMKRESKHTIFLKNISQHSHGDSHNGILVKEIKWKLFWGLRKALYKADTPGPDMPKSSRFKESSGIMEGNLKHLEFPK